MKTKCFVFFNLIFICCESVKDIELSRLSLQLLAYFSFGCNYAWRRKFKAKNGMVRTAILVETASSEAHTLNQTIMVPHNWSAHGLRKKSSRHKRNSTNRAGAAV